MTTEQKRPISASESLNLLILCASSNTLSMRNLAFPAGIADIVSRRITSPFKQTKLYNKTTLKPFPHIHRRTILSVTLFIIRGGARGGGDLAIGEVIMRSIDSLLKVYKRTDAIYKCFSVYKRCNRRGGG